MKKFTFKMTIVLELPDDFELAEVSTDGHEALKRGSCYYCPQEVWMQRHHYLGSSVEGPPRVVWEAVDDDTANDFNNACTYNGLEISPDDTA
jgi:hypothetical protein